MDIILNLTDDYIFTPYVYPTSWAEDDVYRQFLSISIIMIIGGYLMYLLPAILSYHFIFDHDLKKHPLFLKKYWRNSCFDDAFVSSYLDRKENHRSLHTRMNQIRKEVTLAVISVPIMSVLSSIMFLVEIRGYCRMYDNVSDNQLGWLGLMIDMTAFVLFTEILAYWTHRTLHHKLIYKHLHKAHHIFKIPTPFASHAFHPIDGFLQSLCFHLYVILFPMHKLGFLATFIFVNLWTVSIHEGDCRVPEMLKHVVNGSAHHTEHHLHYNYNYGQFFTFCDKLGGSLRQPSAFVGKGPIFDAKNLRNENNNTKDK